MKVALDIYSDGTEMEVYFAVPSPLGVLPSEQKTEAIPLFVADPEDACSPLNTKHIAGMCHFGNTRLYMPACLLHQLAQEAQHSKGTALCRGHPLTLQAI